MEEIVQEKAELLKELNDKISIYNMEWHYEVIQYFNFFEQKIRNFIEIKC